MAGVIRADRGKCECGGEFKRRKRRDFICEIPVCDACGDTPEKYVIRINLPGGKKDIRYTVDGRRLSTASLADTTLLQIRERVRTKTFDPLLYMNAGQKSEFLFKNFAEVYIKTRVKDVNSPLTPNAEQCIRSALKNYLNPFFGETFIQEITSGMIRRFELTWEPVKTNRLAKTTRPRDIALETLRTVLRFAYKLEALKVVPPFPDIPKARKNRNTVDIKTQEQILCLVREPEQTAIRMMRLLLCRHCELRVLRRSDIDRVKRGVNIRRHLSRQALIQGRKSISDPNSDFFHHFVPVGDEFFELLDRIPANINPDSPIFHNEGRPWGPNAINKAWRKAVTKFNEKNKTSVDIDSYRGIKSSTGQALIDAGVSINNVRLLMGQTSLAATSHYVRETAETARGGVEGVLRKAQDEKMKDIERLKDQN